MAGVKPAVKLAGLGKSFDGMDVLKNVNLTVAPGEFVVLLGRSGSGKSTLLRIAAGLDRDIAGTVDVAGSVSVAFQEPRLLPWRRIWQNIVLGLPTGRASRETATEALAEVELSGMEDRWPLTLSGGQAQRVSLARALVRRPDVLLLDEPFGALDALTRMAMHRLVGTLWLRHRPAVLLVTHDVDEAVLLSDRVLLLGDGHVIADYDVNQRRPRSRASMSGLRSAILNDLGVTDDEAA